MSSLSFVVADLCNVVKQRVKANTADRQNHRGGVGCRAGAEQTFIFQLWRRRATRCGSVTDGADNICMDEREREREGERMKEIGSGNQRTTRQRETERERDMFCFRCFVDE